MGAEKVTWIPGNGVPKLSFTIATRGRLNALPTAALCAGTAGDLNCGRGGEGSDDTDHVEAGLHNVYPAAGVDRRRLRGGNPGFARRSAIAGIAGYPTPRHGGDYVGSNIHLADTVRAEIGDVNIRLGVPPQADGGSKLGESRVTPIAAVSNYPGPGIRMNHPNGVYKAHSVVAGIRNKKVACGVYHYSVRGRQSRERSGLLITVISGITSARNGGNDLRKCIHSADSIISIVSDEEIAERIQGNVVGVVELRGGRYPAVSVITAVAGARDGRDDTRYAIDTPDSEVKSVGNIQVPGTVEGDPGWVKQTRRSCRDVININSEAIAGNRRDHSIAVDLAYAVVPLVGNIDVPVRMNGDVGRIVQLSCCRLSAVAQEPANAGSGEGVNGSV